jgi:hypothetical protein
LFASLDLPNVVQEVLDQMLYVHEAVSFLEPPHVTMVAFRMMVIVKHYRPAFTGADKGQTVADAVRILRAGRDLPYPGFIEVSPLICCLFVK